MPALRQSALNYRFTETYPTMTILSAAIARSLVYLKNLTQFSHDGVLFEYPNERNFSETYQQSLWIIRSSIRTGFVGMAAFPELSTCSGQDGPQHHKKTAENIVMESIHNATSWKTSTEIPGNETLT